MIEFIIFILYFFLGFIIGRFIRLYHDRKFTTIYRKLDYSTEFWEYIVVSSFAFKENVKNKRKIKEELEKILNAKFKYNKDLNEYHCEKVCWSGKMNWNSVLNYFEKYKNKFSMFYVNIYDLNKPTKTLLIKRR